LITRAECLFRSDEFYFKFAHEAARMTVASDGKRAGHHSVNRTCTDVEQTYDTQPCGWLLIPFNIKTVENGKCIQRGEDALKGETDAAASRAS
jgi:hypothetical protein